MNKGKARSVLEFLQGALNYFNGNPMPCTTALNCLENAHRTELLLQTAVKNVQHVIVQTAQKQRKEMGANPIKVFGSQS